MAMLRELHLHIGLPKTGTSAIQAGLKANRAAIEATGLTLAPMSDLSGQHHPLTHLLSREGVDAFYRVLDEAGAERQLVSSEILFETLIARPETLDRLLARKDVKIVFYMALRRLDTYIESAHAQRVRNYYLGHAARQPKPISAFVKDDIGPDPAQVAAIRSLVERVVELRGPDAMMVWTYPGLRERDSFRDFLSRIGVTLDPDGLVSVGTTNTSLHRRKMMLLSQISPMTPTAREAVFQQVYGSPYIEDDGQRWMLPPDLRRRIVLDSADGLRAVAAVARMDPADLDALTTPGPEEPDWHPPRYFNRREITRFLHESWYQMRHKPEGVVRRGPFTEGVIALSTLPLVARALKGAIGRRIARWRGAGA